MEEYVWRWFVFRKIRVLIGGKAAFWRPAGVHAHHVIALGGPVQSGVLLCGLPSASSSAAGLDRLYLRYRSIWPGLRESRHRGVAIS